MAAPSNSGPIEPTMVVTTIRSSRRHLKLNVPTCGWFVRFGQHNAKNRSTEEACLT